MGWLLPVGIPAGVNFGFSGVAAGSGMVRMGPDILVVPPVLYGAWVAAARFPDWDELQHWGTESDVPDIAGPVRSLCDAGLLISESQDALSQIGTLAVTLLGECLGNTAESEEEFSVLGRDGTKVCLDLRLHEILLRSNGVTGLASICDALDRYHLDPSGAGSLEVVARSLPALVRCGIARADRSVR